MPLSLEIKNRNRSISGQKSRNMEQILYVPLVRDKREYYNDDTVGT